MNLIRSLALHLVGIPYKYGGRSPNEGLDCSELVQLLLRAGGADPMGDQTAQDLYNYFSQPANRIGDKAQLGSLIFYASGKDPKRVYHVAFCLDNKRHLEAACGEPHTLTAEIANAKRALRKITPIRFDSQDFLDCVLPYYPAAQE